MPSTVTTPVAARLRIDDVAVLERWAAERGLTLSMVLRQIVEQATRDQT